MDPQQGPGGPFGLLQQLEGVRVSGQGSMLGAAESVKLDLVLGDFPEPGVRQLWRKQGFYWKPVCMSLERLSGTYFLPSAQSVD